VFRRSRSLHFGSQARRARWGLPGWCWLLLAGIAIGAGGLWTLQARVLPPHLSVAESERLKRAFAGADGERQRLTEALAGTTQRLDAALQERQTLAQDLAARRAEVTRLQGDLAAVVAALPADPRNGAVEVRAARFAAVGGGLSYDVVLSRSRSADKPMAGQMQLVVTGASAQDAATSIKLQPIALSLGRHEVLRGRLPLPAGFRPQQTTVRILDRAQGQLLGQRVLVVR
jgi:hypothetical protein